MKIPVCIRNFRDPTTSSRPFMGCCDGRQFISGLQHHHETLFGDVKFDKNFILVILPSIN